MKALLLLLLLAMFAYGCAHQSESGFERGHGDLRQVILNEVRVRGGSPLLTSNLPRIPGVWRYFKDQNGIVIRLPRSSYPSVEAFLHAAFGEPRLHPKDSPDSEKYGHYRLSEKGGVISFSRDSENTQICVIRPVSTDEVLQRIPGLLQEMEKRQTQ